MICRLCLNEISDIILIFGELGQKLNIANVLGKYFWFEPRDDDPISTALCNTCWNIVFQFHEFYISVEKSHRLLTERFSVKPTDNNIEKQIQTNTCDSLPNCKFEPDDSDISALQEDNVSDLQENTVKCLEQENSEFSNQYEQKSDPNTNDFAHIFMDTNSDYDSSDNDDEFQNDFLEIQVEETLSNTNGPRITRSHIKKEIISDATIKNEDTDDENTCSETKKRRGRPPKRKMHTNKTHIKKANIPKITKERKIKSINLEQNSRYEIKNIEAEQKIANHMRLVCDVCADIQPTFLQLRKHMEQTHRCKGYAICCNKKFFKRVFLIDHIEKHNNPDFLRCSDCDKSFADKQCLRNHILLKHQPEEVKVHQCEHCPKKFAKPYLLEQHRVTHDERTHLCTICEKSFASKGILSNHVKMIHSNYGIMCDICAKVIKGRALFDRHQLEHKGVLVKVQCERCGSWHKDKYSLQKHIRRHNNDGSVHICNICGKESPNRSAMLAHKRYVHAAMRAFECGVCKKAFKKAITLKEHMATHTGAVLYKCPIENCTKTFNSNANMHSHRKKAHPKEFEEARKVRRENLQNPNGQNISITKAATVEGISELITIKTQDDGETHNILIATMEPNEKDADESNSITFHVH